MILCFLFLSAGILFWNSLPEPLFDRSWSKVLYSSDGKLLGAKIANDHQWRFPLRESVPEKFQQSILTFEDKRFHHHIGIDPLALFRAFYKNVKAGRVVNGGSTISMQVIRLARNNPPRTLFEKVVEMLLTLRLEIRYSKQEILSFYTAHAPFGGNVVGLEAASWRYFGRSPNLLSWSESAMLAVLPNSPSLIHLGKNRKRLKKKRDRLLKKLLDQAIIDELDYELAISEPLPKEPVPLPRVAPHLLNTLISKDRKKGEKETAFFQTTLNLRIQKNVTEKLNQHAKRLRDQGIGNVAALVVANGSSKVLAYVGNSLTGEGKDLDIIQRPRSTGSILKPFLYAAMLQDGELLPKTLVPDIPSHYSGFSPKNYDRTYNGAVPANAALARSLNVPAVRMLQQYGIARFQDFLKEMGITTLHRTPEGYGLTLVLGGAEATLWDLVKLYSGLAELAIEGATYPMNHQYEITPPMLIQTEKKAKRHTVRISPATAWLTLEALLEAIRPGVEGFWKNFDSSRKIAWKTGTSNGFRDAWAIGITPKYTVGVWAGNANGQGNPDLKGTTAAAPLLFDIFHSLERSEWFERPDEKMKEVKVCRLSGMLATEQCEGEVIKIPKESHYSKLCPWHQLVHLDKDETWRVHGKCESVYNMKRKNWFVLPPRMEFFYRKYHPEYRTLPPFRADCRATRQDLSGQNMLGLIYPDHNSQIYIPIELNEKRGKVVLEAVHRNHDATIFWHLDEEYLGKTKVFHQMAVQTEPGKHRLILIDHHGNRLARTFLVLGQTSKISNNAR